MRRGSLQTTFLETYITSHAPQSFVLSFLYWNNECVIVGKKLTMLWKHLIVAVAAALASFSIALPAPTSYVLHEKRDRPAHGYTRLERVGGSSIIPLRIGLSQSNLDKGYDHLMDV